MKKLLIIFSITIVAIAGSFFFSPFEKGGLRGILSLFFPPLLSKEGQGEVREVEAAAPRSGLVLDLNFGNNDGSATPTVFDTSGLNHPATSTAGATAPTCTKKFCDFDGSADVMTEINGGIFSNLSAGATIVIKFAPDFLMLDGASHTLFAQMPFTGQNILCKSAAGNLSVISGASTVGYVSGANYAHLWKVGQPNIYILSINSGDNKSYFNGVMTYNGSASPTDVSTENMQIGNGGAYAGYFDGKIYYIKVYNRRLTAAEIALLSADRTAYTPTPSRASSTPVSGGKLVGWWTMDVNDMSTTGATLYDKSGLGNNGTVTGTTTSTGKIGQARSFNGTSEYIALGTAPSILGTSNFSLSAWIKTSSNLESEILTQRDASVANGAYRLKMNTGGTVAFNIYNASYEWGSAWDSLSSSAVNNGKWHLVTATRNGLTGSIYIDGALNNSNASGAGLSLVSANVYIGYDVRDSLLPFNGPIDDVRIYNYALSAQEVANLYNSAARNYSVTPTRTGLVGHWTMDANDVNGINYYDKSGNNNTATSTASPTVGAGKIGQAVALNGSTQRLSAPNSQFNFGTGNFTASIWAKFTGLGAYRSLLATYKANSDGNQGFILQAYDGTNNKMCFYVGSGSANIISNAVLQTGRWYHFVGVRNGDNGFLYIDGVLDNSTAGLAAKNVASPSVLEIGTQLFQYNMAGSLDDIRIYNRALSAQEVFNLYNSSARDYK